MVLFRVSNSGVYKRKHVSLFFLVLNLLIISPISNAAGIQKWIDNEGRTHYGTQPPSSLKAKTVDANVSVVDVNKTNSKVIIYTTSRCGYCKKAKAFMNENNIQYREYDVEKNQIARSQYKRLGGKAVPFLVKQGAIIRGYTKQKYKAFFGI